MFLGSELSFVHVPVKYFMVILYLLEAAFCTVVRAVETTRWLGGIIQATDAD